MIYARILLANFFILNGAYFVAAGFVLWLVFTLRIHGLYFWNLIKKNPWEVVLALGLATAVFGLGNIGLRIFSDETNLFSVSQNITWHMRAVNNLQGYFLPSGEYISITNEVPTRPLLFPFLTALFNWTRGVQLNNVFILNFILLALLLYTSLVVLRGKPWWLSTAAVFAIAFNGTLSIHAVTGGFDLCSLLFGLWTFLALASYLRDPQENTLLVLFLTAICFVQVRYESLIVLAFLVFAVAYVRRGQVWQDLKKNWFLFLVPLLLLPALAQRFVTWGRFENPRGIAPFSFGNIFSHLPEVSRFFFIEFSQAYPCLLDILGIIGIIFLIRRKKSPSEKLFFWILFSYGIALALVLLAHYMGIAESSTQMRLFMPLTVLLTWAALFGWNGKRWKQILVAVFCLIQGALGIRYLKLDPQMKNLAMAQETKALEKFFDEHPLKDVLFLYRRPGQLIALGHSSVLPSFYLQNEEDVRLMLKNQQFRYLYEISPLTVDSNPPPFNPLSNWSRDLRYEIPVNERFKMQIFELSMKKDQPAS